MDNNLPQTGIRIGIIGLGTVGCGVIEVLHRNQLEITRRAGQAILIKGVCARDKHKARPIDISDIHYFDSAEALIDSPEIDIVVELIGGCTDAKNYILRALERGKPVVTANKALIAEQGNAIFKIAHEQQGIIGFEAAVAGGIPIIKTIREGLGGNRIQAIVGIINGTCNYILTKMQKDACDFKTALSSAQKKGYAESDPSLDILGIDTAHKLAILAANAFGTELNYHKIFCEGIDQIELKDIEYADHLGYQLKHLALAKETADGLDVRVHPTLIPHDHMLAHVENAMNAVLIQANALGPTLYYGKGAGSEATASAIVADLLDVARAMGTYETQRVPYLSFHKISQLPWCSIEDSISAYYIRLEVEDKPGVLADITHILANNNISIESFVQKKLNKNYKNQTPKNYVPLLIIIKPTKTRDFLKAKQQMNALKSVQGPIVSIRLDQLDFEGSLLK